MPIGSKFSIEQIIIALSLESLITSISNSFQPIKDSSINTSFIGLASSPIEIDSLNSSRLYATDPPVPPKVNDGRMITGNCIVSKISFACFFDLAKPPLAVFIPTSSIAFLNISLFSAFLID